MGVEAAEASSRYSCILELWSLCLFLFGCYFLD